MRRNDADKRRNAGLPCGHHRTADRKQAETPDSPQSELRRDLEGISQKVLTDSLRSMEEDGILTRTVYPEVPPRVEYALGGLGQSLRPIIEAMAEWGQNYKDRFQVRKTDRNALLRSPGGPQVLIHRRCRGPVARAYVCSDLRAAWCFRARNIPAKERVAQ